MTLEPGTTLGRYQVLAPLGHGGMASVYKAFQPALERVVALKVLRPAYAHDPEFLERFRREAKAIARLRHPHIVQVHDFEESDGQVYLVMEHIEGGTLKAKLTQLQRQGQRLPAAEVGRIVREVAEALSHAHAQGIVHRDVKPSNVMLTRDGKAVVTDFGIAKILAAAGQTQTGIGVGTPEYMSPEQGQASAGVDHRSDIYSLGVLAYELLVGRVPFAADTPLAVMLAHVRDPLPLPSKVDPRIGPKTEQVLLRALAKDPSARYGAATELASALEAALAQERDLATLAPTIARGDARAARGAVPAIALPRAITLPLPPSSFLAGLAGGVLVLALIGGGAAVLGVFGGGGAAPNDRAAGPVAGSSPAPAPPTPPTGTATSGTVVGTLSTPIATATLPLGQPSPVTASAPLPAARTAPAAATLSPPTAALPTATVPPATPVPTPAPTPAPPPTFDPSAPRFTVSGRVRSAVTGAGLGGIQISVFFGGPRCCSGVPGVGSRTDAAGNYTVSLPNGTYWLHAIPEPATGYAVRYWRSGRSASTAEELVVSGQPLTNIDLSLVTGFAVTGTVKDAAGVSLAEAWVIVHYAGQHSSGATTDSAGRFLHRLESGTYDLLFYPPTVQCCGEPNLRRTVTVGGADLSVGDVRLP